MITALNVTKLRLDMGEYVLSVQNLQMRGGGAPTGIDLDVKRGGATAVIGPAGAGKSLLFACIAGAVRPTRGRIRYFGYEIGGRPQTRVARMGIVRTHQIAQPFGAMTVFETVVAGALLRQPRLVRAQALACEIIDATGLNGHAASTFAALAAVDRMRLELARAAATGPQVLLLDDLAGGLAGSDGVALAAAVSAVRLRGVTLVAAARRIADCPFVPDDVVEIQRGTTAGNAKDAAVNVRA